MKVGILMGSASDAERMAPVRQYCERLGVEAEEHVLSAHRDPDAVGEFAASAATSGFGVLVCGAGMAAHLAGAVAARTTLPVIGVPLSGGLAGGLDALLATVQMPRGVPVATVAVDGAVNAALLAVQILALSDAGLAARFAELKAAGGR
ncbi:MAG: 5-(carboxyamino)imidazole ribonucleotide mutase [Acidimicrobiales bacterium]